MDTPETYSELVELLVFIITDGILYLLTAVIFLLVVWKIIDGFIINVSEEPKRTSSKKTILAGLIVLVVFLSLWGIVTLLRTSIFG